MRTLATATLIVAALFLTFPAMLLVVYILERMP